MTGNRGNFFNTQRLNIARATVAAARTETGGDCGCGRLIPAATLRAALKLGRKVVCSVCGARGEPGIIQDVFYGNAFGAEEARQERAAFEAMNRAEAAACGFCDICGDQENHDGERCPMYDTVYKGH